MREHRVFISACLQVSNKAKLHKKERRSEAETATDGERLTSITANNSAEYMDLFVHQNTGMKPSRTIYFIMSDTSILYRTTASLGVRCSKITSTTIRDQREFPVVRYIDRFRQCCRRHSSRSHNSSTHYPFSKDSNLQQKSQ